MKSYDVHDRSHGTYWTTNCMTHLFGFSRKQLGKFSLNLILGTRVAGGLKHVTFFLLKTRLHVALCLCYKYNASRFQEKPKGIYAFTENRKLKAHQYPCLTTV